MEVTHHSISKIYLTAFFRLQQLSCFCNYILAKLTKLLANYSKEERKGRFPLGDFTAKFIWACAFLFVYSLAGEIFLFKIVKMDLTIHDEKIRHNCLTNLNVNIFQSLLFQQIHFNQIKSKVAANNMSNIHLQMFFQLYAIIAGQSIL